jgi:DNA-binding IclR family transcriptional regulator
MDMSSIPPAKELEGRIARTTVTSFRIIEALAGRDAAGVSELADELSLGKGTVHKHLTTLRELDCVVKEGDSYRLGLRFLGLGAGVRARMELYESSYELLKNLASATGAVVGVMVPEDGLGVYLVRLTDDDSPPFALHEGERVPLTATAGGKAILAYMPDSQREALLDEHGLPRLTENTITDRTALREELKDVHDRHLAHDRGELETGRHCVAAPIVDGDGSAVGAVTVSGPADRMTEKSANTDIPSIVSSTAYGIENRLEQ